MSGYDCQSCQSSFHADEIVEWLQDNDRCPNCRSEIDPYDIFQLTDAHDLQAKGSEVDLETGELRDDPRWQHQRRRAIQRFKFGLFMVAVLILLYVITGLFFSD